MNKCTHTLSVLAITGLAVFSFSMAGYAKEPFGVPADFTLSQARQKIIMGFNTDPDTDAWNEQRQKISSSTGDRIFEKDYNRVYDSLVLAVSTLELTVKNMERASGFIQAEGIALPPKESKEMYDLAIRDWCKQKGHDSSVLDRKYSDPQGQLAMLETVYKSGAKVKSVTFQLVKMGENQTKVKLRFAGVFYPAEVEAFNKLIWGAVDKQIFVDKTIEGAVEERKAGSDGQMVAKDAKFDELVAQIAELRKSNAEMKTELAALKARLDTLASPR